jgi:hypothetical protein
MPVSKKPRKKAPKLPSGGGVTRSTPDSKQGRQLKSAKGAMIGSYFGSLTEDQLAWNRRIQFQSN